MKRKQTWNYKKLSELCDFKKLEIDLPKERLERVQNIDVIWIKDNKIFYVFEVENTTAINIEVLNKYIIIPEERENLLYKKIKESALKELNIEELFRIL